MSIIVPVYNIEEEIGDCLASLVKQTYTHLQIILVNDGSTDRSLLICQKWAKKDPRILVVDQENSGQADARNKGLEYATGKWIAMIDGDDYVREDYISKMVSVAEKYKVQLVNCGCKYIEGENETALPAIDSEKLLSEDEFWLLYFKGGNYRGNYQAPWGKLYSKDIFDSGIRYKKGIIHEDLDILYDLIRTAQSIVIIPDLLYYYRQRGNSTTHKINQSRKVDFQMLEVVERLYKNFLKDRKYRLGKYELEENINLLCYYIYASNLTLSDIKKLKHTQLFLEENSQLLKEKGYPIKKSFILKLRLFTLWCVISKVKSIIKK